MFQFRAVQLRLLAVGLSYEYFPYRQQIFILQLSWYIRTDTRRPIVSTSTQWHI